MKLVNLKDEEKSYNSNSSILHILELTKDTQKSLGYVIRNFAISNFKISQVLAEITHSLGSSIIFTGISNYKSVSHQSQKHVGKRRSGKF